MRKAPRREAICPWEGTGEVRLWLRPLPIPSTWEATAGRAQWVLTGTQAQHVPLSPSPLACLASRGTRSSAPPHKQPEFAWAQTDTHRSQRGHWCVCTHIHIHMGPCPPRWALTKPHRCSHSHSHAHVSCAPIVMPSYAPAHSCAHRASCALSTRGPMQLLAAHLHIYRAQIFAEPLARTDKQVHGFQAHAHTCEHVPGIHVRARVAALGVATAANHAPMWTRLPSAANSPPDRA